MAVIIGSQCVSITVDSYKVARQLSTSFDTLTLSLLEKFWCFFSVKVDHHQYALLYPWGRNICSEELICIGSVKSAERSTNCLFHINSDNAIGYFVRWNKTETDSEKSVLNTFSPKYSNSFLPLDQMPLRNQFIQYEWHCSLPVHTHILFPGHLLLWINLRMW